MVITIKTPRQDFFQKFFKNNRFLLYRIFKKFDNSRSISLKNAKKNRSIFELKINIPEISVYPKQKKFSDVFSTKESEEIRKYDLDILFRIGFRIIKGDIFKSSKFGVWSFHHGDNDYYRGGPHVFGN